MKRYYDDGFDVYPNNTGTDLEGSKVQFASEHEKVINTFPKSPIEKTITVDGQNIRVISLFAREEYELNLYPEEINARARKDVDGNPVIYALKEIYGWSFVTPENRRAFMDQVKKVVWDNLKNEKYDLLIAVPSAYDLNSEIADILQKKTGAILESVLEKKPLAEVILEIHWDELRKDRGARAVGDLHRNISKMGKFFEMKKVTHREEVLSYIKNIFQMDPNIDLEDIDALIRGKDVLVIDDTITSGGSITFSTRAVLDFEPKSVTVLTAFSAKSSRKMDDYYGYYDESDQPWYEEYDDPDYYLLD